MVISTDPTHCAPVAGYHIKRAVKNGIPLVVADPRRTELAAHASSWLRITPGSCLDFLNGLAALLLQANGYDRTFIDKHTEGFSLFRYGLSSVDPDKIRRTTRARKRSVGNRRLPAEREKNFICAGSRHSAAAKRATHHGRPCQSAAYDRRPRHLKHPVFTCLPVKTTIVGALDMGTVPGYASRPTVAGNRRCPEKMGKCLENFSITGPGTHHGAYDRSRRTGTHQGHVYYG